MQNARKTFAHTILRIVGFAQGSEARWMSQIIGIIKIRR